MQKVAVMNWLMLNMVVGGCQGYAEEVLISTLCLFKIRTVIWVKTWVCLLYGPLVRPVSIVKADKATSVEQTNKQIKSNAVRANIKHLT